MRNIRHIALPAVSLMLALTISCRKEETVLDPDVQHVCDGVQGDCKGFYLLNEGNMGSNSCSLDWFDYASGTYSTNIFPSRNPHVAMELGDVGNDIAIYGGKLYATINCSNFVEVMDAFTAGHIGQIAIPNCRNLAFSGKYAYVTSYAGPVGLDPNARKGYVAKVDTSTLEVVDTCTVGYQPEGMAIVEGADGLLYVANSGGYMFPCYDRTVSVIDLATFSEIGKIDVAPNLKDIIYDGKGRLWISSRGDYAAAQSGVYVLDIASGEVSDAFAGIPAASMTRHGSLLYVLGDNLDGDVIVSVIDMDSMTVTNDDFLAVSRSQGIKYRTPYGIAANPDADEVYVTDAIDYLTPGTVYCFDSEGFMKWSATTGNIPGHFAFLTSSGTSDR